VESELLAAGGEFARAAVLARDQIAARLFMAAPLQVRIADRYVVGDRIGAGGQGTVWRARDTQLDRNVAIKVVHVTDLGRDEAANLLLRREAQMLGRIAHPGVVAVFDLGLCPASSFGGPRDDRMALFLVMELVGGVGLDEWIRVADRSTDEVLDVMRQIAAGLAAVHACGLVHCDVKPGNILVDGGTAKLADFGLAHATRSIAAVFDDNPITGSSTLRSMVAARTGLGPTSAGVTLRSLAPMGGTPRYMAPEQMTGGVIDSRADEFALAATLFEALYWRPPHEGQTLQALRAAKQRGAPNQPEKRLGGRAYSALARCMAPDPAARHGDVVAAMQAITIAQRTEGRRVRLGLGCLAVLGVLGLTMPTSTPCEQAASPGIDQRTATEALATIADEGDDVTRRVVDRVLVRLRAHESASSEARASACAAPREEVASCLDRVDVAARAAATALAEVDVRQSHRALTIVDAIPDPRTCLGGAADPTVFGPALDPADGAAAALWVRLMRARALNVAGNSRAALDLLDECEIDLAMAGVLTTEVMLARGDALHHLDRFEESIVAYQQAYERADRAGASLDAARAAADAGFSAGVEMQRFEEGLAWVRHGESHLQRASTPSRIAADLANTRGAIYFRSGRYDEARGNFERALELAEGGPNARVRSIRENVGVLRFLDDDPDALDYMTASYELVVEAVGEEHPETVAALANLGNAQAHVGRRADARISLERALALGEAVFGVDGVDNARLLTSLAELDELDGDPSSALARLRRAAAVRERVYPEEHPERAQEPIELATLLMTTGDLDGAARILDANVDRFAATFIDAHPLAIDFTHARGELALRRGEYAEASRLLGSAVESSRSLGRETADLPVWLLEAARAELGLGRVEAARVHVDAAFARYDELTLPMQGELDRLRTELALPAAAPPS